MDIHVQRVTRQRVGSNHRENAEDNGQEARPESDGPTKPQPPAIPDPTPALMVELKLRMLRAFRALHRVSAASYQTQNSQKQTTIRGALFWSRSDRAVALHTDPRDSDNGGIPSEPTLRRSPAACSRCSVQPPHHHKPVP
jgi:hypothetical protein